MKRLRLQNLFFETVNKNEYYLDEKNNQFFYTHPLLFFLYHNIIENKNKDFLNSLSYPIIVKGIEYIENEVIYYYKKMQFLQRHKIIKSVKKNTFYENMSKETVNEAIANTDTLVLEMTQKCNLRCLYCTYGELYNRDPFRKNADIDIKMVIKLIIFLYENFWNTDKNYSIRKRINISFYGGEPLIQFKKIKDIVELTEKLRNNKVYFSYTITTNGTLINEEIANFFVKYNFQVGISIDGNRENNSYRIFANGIEIYDKLIEKINFLKANYPNFFRENVLFMSVLHSKNSIKEINSYLRDKYNKIVSIGPLNPVGVIKEKRHLFEKMSNESFFDKSSEKLNFEKDLRSIIISYNPYIYHSIVELFLEKNKLRFPTGTCVPLKKKIFISSKGLVLPCEKIDFRYNFGNINDENEDFSKIIDNVVKTHSLHLNQIKKTCHLCYYNNVCNKCMYNFEQDRFNRFICNHFCNKQNFKESMGQIIGTVETRPDLLISILNDFRIM